MSLREICSQELVEFKGNKRGIIVNIKREAPFEEIQEKIINKLEAYVGFLMGLKLVKLIVIV